MIFSPLPMFAYFPHRPEPGIFLFKIFKATLVKVPPRRIDHGVGMPEQGQDATDAFHGLRDLHDILKRRIFIQAHAFHRTEHSAILDDERHLHNRQFFLRLQIVEPPRIACPEAKADVVVEPEGAVIAQARLGLDAGRDADVVMEVVLPDADDVMAQRRLQGRLLTLQYQPAFG
jgi:hypothetical protein